MKGLLLLLSLFCTLAWAQDDDYETAEITDQQRCREWAEMDGTESSQLAHYMSECMASLGHESPEHESFEPAQNPNPFEEQVDDPAEDAYQDQSLFDEKYDQEQSVKPIEE